MDFKKIEQLIKIVEQSDINGLAVEENDFKIEIQKNNGQVVTLPSAPAVMPAVSPAENSAEAEQIPADLKEIKSPMSGTFYRAASPGAQPLVNVGDIVTQGQPVCIVEAMKTFNEIESDWGGKIEKILVADAQPVEIGQPLLLIRE